MKEMYIANKNEVIKLIITNKIEVESIVFLNDAQYDSVLLAGSRDNIRVLEIDLKQGDVLSVKENELIKYTIE